MGAGGSAAAIGVLAGLLLAGCGTPRLAALPRRPALDALLAMAQPSQPLADRVAWLEDLLAWLRRWLWLWWLLWQRL